MSRTPASLARAGSLTACVVLLTTIAFPDIVPCGQSGGTKSIPAGWTDPGVGYTRGQALHDTLDSVFPDDCPSGCPEPGQVGCAESHNFTGGPEPYIDCGEFPTNPPIWQCTVNVPAGATGYTACSLCTTPPKLP
jgi:hypothetical protein